MGNIITNTVGKFAGNVTQGVATALIVAAISTYLMVDLGKKDAKPAGADSAKSNTTLSPTQISRPEGEPGTQRKAETANPEEKAGENTLSTGGAMKTLPVPATEEQPTQKKAETPERVAASKAFKELPPETPAEKKLESTITEGRAKGDSLLNAHPQDEKAKQAKQEEKKDLKDVKKRADDVFDELDQEANKK